MKTVNILGQEYEWQEIKIQLGSMPFDGLIQKQINHKTKYTMFTNPFKSKKTEQLKKEVESLKDKLETQQINLLKLEHFVHNKPKYKVGQKVKGELCIEVLQIPETDFWHKIVDYRWKYTFVDIKTGEKRNIID